MKTAPITPAHIEFDDEGVPHAPLFGDRYHARAGALAQAEHVFLRGNGLPTRWAGRGRFIVLETGFGLGHNFLATWAAWRGDAARCERLHFVSVEKHPPRREDLARAHARSAHAGLPADLAPALQAAWPPLTGDLHRLCFEGGRVELLLALGDAATWLRRLQLQADALFLDGFAPERNAEMWSDAVFAALPALCGPGTTASTWSVARGVREGLAREGFEVERAPGFADKREMTVARFAPRHRAAPHARRQAAQPAARDALVIGAGLAGAAAALALAEQGLAVTVIEAAPGPAEGASGNPAGLLRGIVSRDDGAHARWHRAAALEAQRQASPWVAAGAVPGRLDGVLHLGDDLGAMQAQAAAALWPADYVQALAGVDAATLTGLPLASPGWLFPGGGWVDPGALSGHILVLSGATLRFGCRVTALQRRGARWLACAADGPACGEADIVVLANSSQAATLVPPGCAAAWNLRRSRGQVTWLRPALVASAIGAASPRLPLARNGYVIPLPDGSVLCGATQWHDAEGEDMSPQDGDHQHNLRVLGRLMGRPIAGVAMHSLGGRVRWRCHTDDRLPLVGAVPAPAGPPMAGHPAQPRYVPREPGLFTLTALGSRGITAAALGARTLAALVCDAPSPVDTDLLDAIDPARQLARAARRSTSATPASPGTDPR